MKNIYDWIHELLLPFDNPVIFEIGANTGSDTVKLAAIEGAMVHAFEPEPRCDLSGLPGNVAVNRVAVSDMKGSAEFNLSDSPGHVWTYSSSLLKPKNHLTAHKHVQFTRKVTVDTIRLDDYCRDHAIDHIDFLWMDVQGAEAKVFAGGSEILKHTRYIYTEYSDDEMYEGQVPLSSLLSMLKTFSVIDVWPKEPSNVLLRNDNYHHDMIIRIDDFPSGVRPVLPDLTVFFRIFDHFEANNIRFHLGIVPDVLKNCVIPEDQQRLKTYKCLVPCQHGYDHRYFEMSAKLMKAGDLYNRKTLGTFNEFENVDPLLLNKRIAAGKKYLEEFFSQPVDYYIPVCNIIDQPLINALRANRFRRMFTMKYNTSKAGPMRQILTAFSGKLADWDRSPADCIGLHITWEYDYVMEHGWDAWVRVFNEKILNRQNNVVPIQNTTVEKAPEQNDIPRIANFYWNTETPLSFLRYLTLATFRHHHPGWKMNLWTSASNRANVWAGDHEKQDFQSYTGKNYLDELTDLDVQVIPFNYQIAEGLAPNYISDIARFRTIDDGGWFFDLDQIFCRPFDDLCSNDFVTGCGGDGSMYCGVLGASPHSGVPSLVNRNQVARLARSNSVSMYGELGNVFLHKLSKTDEWKNATAGERHLITDYHYFYPVKSSGEVSLVYDGKIEVPQSTNNYALHWYGGHPLSQQFNAKYTAEFAAGSTDSISVYCRKIGLL